jgi:hypothetical protein
MQGFGELYSMFDEQEPSADFVTNYFEKVCLLKLLP